MGIQSPNDFPNEAMFGKGVLGSALDTDILQCDTCFYYLSTVHLWKTRFSEIDFLQNGSHNRTDLEICFEE